MYAVIGQLLCLYQAMQIPLGQHILQSYFIKVIENEVFI